MSQTAQRLFDEAKALTPAERVELAERLLESTEGDSDPSVAAAWAAEIERRDRELDEGRAQPVTLAVLRDALRRARAGR